MGREQEQQRSYTSRCVARFPFTVVQKTTLFYCCIFREKKNLSDMCELKSERFVFPSIELWQSEKSQEKFNKQVYIGCVTKI